MNLVRTCNHLELRPKEEDKRLINAYLYDMQEDDTTDEERLVDIKSIAGQNQPFGRYFEPYCKKNNCPCVILESGVLSQGIEMGRFLQPLMFTIANGCLIEDCEDRELPEVHLDGREPLDVFLIKHINTDF